MTRYGIVADAHGNDEALGRCLEYLTAEGVDQIVCLGDVVGYHPGANRCVALLDEYAVDAIAGNHELMALGQLGTERCADKVAWAMARTRRDLSPESRRYLRGLPLRRLYEDRVLVFHAAFDAVDRYLHRDEDVRRTAEAVRAALPSVRVCFFGHTHVRKVHELGAGGLAEVRATPGGGVSLHPERLYLVNPGAVDASRKPGDRKAEVAIFDSAQLGLRFCDVAYDHDAAEERAGRRGYRMPAAFARYYSARRMIYRARERFLRS